MDKRAKERRFERAVVVEDAAGSYTVQLGGKAGTSWRDHAPVEMNEIAIIAPIRNEAEMRTRSE